MKDIGIVAIGGYEEIGRNMTAIRIGHDILIMDMGIRLDRVQIHEDTDLERLRPSELISLGAIPNDSVMKDVDGRWTKLLLTHGHLDHVGAAAEIAARLGIPIEGPHHADDYWLKALPQQCAMFGFPRTEALTPARWLADGVTVSVGEVVLEVLQCPGHTPGHVVFYHRGSKTAFVGDVLFAGSIGRTDFPGGDSDALIDSIRNRLFPLGDDVSFIPGHGPDSTFGRERRMNPYVGDRV